MNDETTLTDTPQPDSAPRGRLERPLEGRVFAGVAAGVADHLGVPPWVIRLALIVSIPFGGLGLLLYLAGWLLIPQVDQEQSIAQAWLDGGRDWWAWIGAGLIAVAVLVGVASLDIASTQLVVAAGLLVFGVLLYRGDVRLSGERPDPAPPVATGEGTEPPPPPVPAVARPARPPRARRPPSMLGRLTVGVAFLAIGGLALLDVADLPTVEPRTQHYLAVALAVVGVGLLAGTWFGRARWLIAVGLLLIPFLIAASVIRFPDTVEFGERFFRPDTVAELPGQYQLAAGQLTVDLTNLPIDGERVVDVYVGTGEIIVIAPPGVGLMVDASVGIGEVEVLGRSSSGFGARRTVQVDGPDLLQITARAGIGAVTVVQASK